MKRAQFLVLLALSAFVSYWFLLRAPPQQGKRSRPRTPARHPALSVKPALSPATIPTGSPPPRRDPRATPQAPPPPEAGHPEGEGEDPNARDSTDKENEADPTKPRAGQEPRSAAGDHAESVRREMATIASSEKLMREAREEVRRRARRGFETVFRCAATDQLDIARFFGEPVVLVPLSGLSPKHPLYYRLDSGPPGRIETVRERPPLERFRQYRDLFAFSYESLPKPLRELRRKVFVRSDVYLFAALIPAREWALVVLRRRAALAADSRTRGGPPRTLDRVKRLTMRYVRLPEGAFDIRVVEIAYTDGTRWKP